MIKISLLMTYNVLNCLDVVRYLILTNTCTSLSRCPVYQNVPDVCTMVPDQSDPTCCQMPRCNFTPVNNTINGQGGGVATLAPGTYQGIGTGVNIGKINKLKYICIEPQESFKK